MLYSWHPYQVRDMLYLLDTGSSPVRRELVFVGRTSIGRINPLSSNGRVLWIDRFVTRASEVIIV